MEDDIDIEEHDLLDNPRIKDIFPDLSKVKIEVNTDDDLAEEEYNPYIQIKQEVDFIPEHQDYDPVCMTEFNEFIDPNVSEARSGVLTSDTSHEISVLPCQSNDMLENTTQNETFHLENAAQITDNVLSLGNCNKSLLKTSVNKSQSCGPLLKLLLFSKSSDVQCDNSIVSNSLKYSSQIFAGSSTVYHNNHESNDIVNDVSDNIVPGSKILSLKTPEIENKEYLPAIVVLEDWGTILKASTCFCDICKILFPTENSLDAHKMSAHSFLVAFGNNKAVLDTESEYETDISLVSGSMCNFVRSNSLNKNISTKPKQTTRGVKKRKFRDCDEESNAAFIIRNSPKRYGEQCYHCNKFFTDYSALVKHLYTLLPDNATRDDVTKVIDNSVRNYVLQCQLCKETFLNETMAKIHKRLMHPNQRGSIIKSCVLDRNERDLNNSKAEIIEVNVRKRKLTKVGNNKSNIDNTNKIDVKNDVVTKDLLIKKQNLEYKYMRGVIIKNPPIPIGVLFKCHKCDLHLINAQNAYDHSKVCKGYKSKYQCKKCKRKFRVCDMEMHELQHLMTKSFKAYIIQPNLLKKLLCRCPKCNICFTERLFWEHLKSPCDKKFIYCKKCKLNIDRETYMKRAHIYCGENVFIDYFDSIEESEVMRKYNNESDGEKDKKIYKLWYCEICKRCGIIDKGNHNCNLKNRSLCKHCGLYFNIKSTNPHIILHSKIPINLHNFLLFSIQKRKFVKPIMLRYKFCPKCKMHYLRWHTTCFESYRICDICSKKFQKDHYILHKQFHTYDLDNLIRETLNRGGYVGYKTPMCIYHCIQCKCFVISYDNAVRHAQSHITRKSLENIHCTKCDRTYESTSFKEHKHSMARFKILKFDYKNLVSDAWFDIFDGLDQVEINYMLKDSVFKDTRSLDLSLIQKGDPDNMTLYVCSSCNVIVEKTALEKHVSSKLYCWANDKYKCCVCDLYFYSPGTMEAHTKLHSNGVKKEDFCIISINNIDTKPISSIALAKLMIEKPIKTCIEPVLHTSKYTKKNTLKLIGIEENNKNSSNLEDRQDYIKSETEDEEAGDINEFSRSKYLARLAIPNNNVIKEITLFKCANCKTCIFNSMNIHRHTCTEYYKRFCNICRQYFTFNNWDRHKTVHTDIAKINIHIKYFQPEKIVYSKMDIRRELKLKKKVDYVSKNSSKFCETRNKAGDKNATKDNDDISGEVLNYPEVHLDESAKEDMSSDTETGGATLFKCTNCKVCLLFYKTTMKHVCCSALKRWFCRICKQLYSCYNFYAHKKSLCNGKEVNTKIKYFTPRIIKHSKIKVPKINRSRYTKVAPIPKIISKGKHSIILNDENIIRDDEDAEIEKSSYKKATENKAIDTRDVEIYKCLHCQTCVLSKSKLYLHCCLIDMYKQFCDICQQFYSAPHFGRHIKWHKKNGNINIILQSFKPNKVNYISQIRKMKTKILNQKKKPHPNCNFKQTSETHTKTTRKNICSNNELSEFDDSEKEDRKHEALIPEDMNSVATKDLEVYKCLNCNICSFSPKNLHRHVCMSDNYKKFCRICRISFMSNKWNKHNSIHNEYKKINIIIKHFKPENINYCSRGKYRRSYSNDEDYKPSYRLRKGKIYVQKESESSLKLNENETNDVYICSQCDLYYLNIPALKHHFKREHKIGRLGLLYCKYCNLRFPMISLRRHLPTCPWKDKRGYIRIIDIENSSEKIHKWSDSELDAVNDRTTNSYKTEYSLDNIGKPSMVDSEDTDLTDTSNETNFKICDENSSSNVVENLNRNPRHSKVYKNNEHTANTTNNENVEIAKVAGTIEEINAILSSDTNEEFLNSVDNLNFVNSVYKDKKDANSNTTVGNVDLESKIINENVDRICKSNVNAESSTNINATDAQDVAKTSNSENIAIKHISNNLHKYENTVDTVNKELTVETNSALILGVTKLFSCSACDVYFLKAECCQVHVVNHMKLDTREYIQCKLCLLQFLIVDLYTHMVTHHGDEFKFENVLIEEFAPNESKPRIYNLKDKLQSLIISTTSMET